MSLVFGSVCSGIEAASVAWVPLGWRAAFLSEIAAFPRAVLAHRHPDVPLRGDFTQIQAGDHDAIDILVGGTPCQSFSVAGLRGGLDDARGNLAREFCGLALRLLPRWIVWENVPGVLSSGGGGAHFAAIVGGLVECGYGVCWRVLDAQYFGLAQRRARVFVVGHLGDWRRAAAVLFEREGMRGDSPPRREAEQGVAGTLAPGAHASGFNGRDAESGNLVAASLAPPLTSNPFGDHESREGLLVAWGGNNTAGPIDVAAAVRAKGGTGHGDFESETFVTHALRASGFDASEDGTGRGTPLTAAPCGVRRLTPRECERLQGFPDDYTLIPWKRGLAPDGPRYAALGNSMAVPVMRWIGERIALMESL